METKEYTLLIDEHFEPILQEQNSKEIKTILASFIKSFTENKDKPLEYSLSKTISEHLPDFSKESIESITEEIKAATNICEEKKKSLAEATSNGRSKESWFASDVYSYISHKSQEEALNLLSELDNVIKTANERLHRTLITQSGNVNRNPNLDGFIAEEYHAHSFNINAQAAGSIYRAKVLDPSPSGYAKNSVDIAILDSNNTHVRHYQVKYCKDPIATQKAFEAGDYRGQKKLVPSGQETAMTKKASCVIESPDGIKSNPLTKEQAMQMRDSVQQQGHTLELGYNEVEAKVLLQNLGKRTGKAALQSAAIVAGLYIASKLAKGEKIEGSEVVKTALETGADIGIKTAVAGALKVGSEKGLISCLPKGTPASTCANIAFVAIEDAKTLWQMTTGKKSAPECVEALARTTVSTTAGIVASELGFTVGASIGSLLSPGGTMIGGFVGETIGYMAGERIGDAIVSEIKERPLSIIKAALSLTGKTTGPITGPTIFSSLLSFFKG